MEEQAGPGALFPGGGSAEPPLPGAPCSLPGALHFLQRQWARFTLDQAQWDVERAELQVRAGYTRTGPGQGLNGTGLDLGLDQE